MRELSIIEINEVSGAGKIQDSTVDLFGALFSGVFNAVSVPMNVLGYTKDQLVNIGKDLGGRVGSLVEDQVNKVIDMLESLVR